MKSTKKLEAEPIMWQPIETAPKDETAILVMRDDWPGNKTGRATECNGHNTYVAAWWSDRWVCYMDMIQDPDCPIEPTHWMPLPPPPIADRKETHVEEMHELLKEWKDLPIIVPYLLSQKTGELLAKLDTEEKK